MTKALLNPFDPSAAPPVPELFKQLDHPLHEALAGFIHGCSPDPTTRTVATTALTLSLWQLQGHALTPELPSLLLIRAEDAGEDPIDTFIRSLVYNPEDNKARVQTAGPFMYGSIDQAAKAMETAVGIRRQLGRHTSPGNAGEKIEARTAEEMFRAALRTAHGHGRSRSYSKAWHPDYGLLTDSDDQLILRLNDDEDRAGFCADFLDRPEKVVIPKGVGADLFPTAKTVSISGALGTELWAQKLAGRALTCGKPFFAIPHAAGSPLDPEYLDVLRLFALTWKQKSFLPIHAGIRLPPDQWVRNYHTALRKRLAVLALPAEFPTLQVIHQLAEICELIVSAACGPDVSHEEVVALFQDLYRHTLRGLVIGMAGYTWFGMGLSLGPECEPLYAKGMRILGKLRNGGELSKSDLLKNFHIKKDERDLLLQRFSEENLVHVDGRHVVATSYREFVDGLYSREEFPPVENFWQQTRPHDDDTEAGDASV